MQKAIIHEQTRVIRNLTTEDLEIPEGFIIINLPEPIDLGVPKGEKIYWKLDMNNQKVPATEDEVIRAGTDDDLNTREIIKKKEQIKAALKKVIETEPTTPFEVALRDYLLSLTQL